MHGKETIAAIRVRFERLKPHLDERQRRLLVAVEVQTLRGGSVRAVSRELKVSPNTIRRGIKELNQVNPGEAKTRIRAVGAGRKRILGDGNQLAERLASLIQHKTRGADDRRVDWDGPSTTDLATKLSTQSVAVSARTIARELQRMGYRLRRGRRKKQNES